MKKIVFLSLFALCLPLGMMAQSNDDDLYFVPSKDKEEPAPVKKVPAKREVTTNIYTTPGTTVVVQDRKGNTRDVDEYNRRYDSRDNEFTMENDTLVIKEKSRPGLEGEWVNGEFEGSQDDYEYAERIIRFRNPRYAISISSPLYWDVVYGANSWDWNVYTDGLYAYAFPTFSNRLWWDWRYNSFGGGWGWGYPYYGWGGYPGYWGGGWGGHWGHHHHGVHYPSWGGGGSWSSNKVYTDRRSSGSFENSRRPGSSANRQESGSLRRSGSSGSSSGRVVGTRVPSSTRSSSSERPSTNRFESVRPGSSSSSSSRDASTRRNAYTRPSSTRSSSTDATRRESVRSSSGTVRSSSGTARSTYNRGSSDAPTRSSSTESTRRSYDNSSSTRSYSPSNSSSSRSSSSYSGGGSSGGSSSRSSGGGSSRSSGGGSSRR